MKHATIKDIAKALGVSISTVSRALNNKYDVNSKTRQLVIDRAAAMGYRPNPIARKLISRKSFLIGVIVPEFTNSFFPEVIRGMQKYLAPRQYQLLIMSSEEDASIELENLKTMEASMVDGILISLTGKEANAAYINNLLENDMPIVMFNRVNEAAECPKVVFNDYKWAYLATEHLIERGYKRILHFCGNPSASFAAHRIQGFKDAMQQYQLPCSEASLVECGLFTPGAEACMEQLLAARQVPEAIFAVNDPAAIGAIRVLKHNGYRVPEDVAVVGFSECVFADLIDPPLTSIAQPTEELGVKAATLLLENIANAAMDTQRTVVLDGKLNIRRSSGD